MRASFFERTLKKKKKKLSCTLYTDLYTQYRHVYLILFCILCTALNALYRHVYCIPSRLLYTTLYFRLLCILHTAYRIIWYCLNKTVPILLSCTFHVALHVSLIPTCAQIWNKNDCLRSKTSAKHLNGLFSSLTKGITPNICWFDLVLINSVLLNLLCVWIPPICAVRFVMYNSGLTEHFTLWSCPGYTLHTVLCILLLSGDWDQSTN